MGYVFGKAFWWILLALLIGGVIGYYWNGWRKKRWVDSSSSTTSSAVSPTSSAAEDSGENMRLRTRIAELQDDIAVVGIERDELAARVAALQADLDDCRSQTAAAPAMAAGMMPAAGDVDETVADEGEADAEEADGAGGDEIHGFAAMATDDVEYDLAAAAAAIGSKIEVDDLKVVEGIGPKIAELIHDGGITTWAELAAAPVERIQEILDAAGERFRIHDPSTWPRQAELLASARWEDFKQLTDDLTGGREQP